MSSNPIPLDELAAALNLADPIEREKAVVRQLNRIRRAVKPPQPRKKPGPKLSEKTVKQATFRVMRRLFPTDNGAGRIQLLKLTPEQLDALAMEEWKRTFEGRKVFEREGEEGLVRYAMEQTTIYKTWKGLDHMNDMYFLVEKEMGLIPREGRKHARGGKFRQWVREGEEEFFFAWAGLTWECLPPNLRRKYCTPEEFEQKQKEYQFKYCSNG